MNYYMAPMEGLTTCVFRSAFHRYYGGIDKYFTPFLCNRHMSSREKNDILPEHNSGMCTIPQILTNRPEDFLSLCQDLASYGYDTVNLNLGCPSGTVVTKGRGAGFLAFPDKLDAFLDEIFSKCPLSISIKTRIGMEQESEWETILSIYQKYPIAELIIHPRLQKEGYGGQPHLAAYKKAEEMLSCPLCYNGDITSPATQEKTLFSLPGIQTVMIGRGLLRNPLLPALLCDENADSSAGSLAATEPAVLSAEEPVMPVTKTQDPSSTGAVVSTLKDFHDTLLDGYLSIMSGDMNTLYKMKDLWTFLGQSFDGAEKYLKAIRKARTVSDYRLAVNAVFRTCPYRPD